MKKKLYEWFTKSPDLSQNKYKIVPFLNGWYWIYCWQLKRDSEAIDERLQCSQSMKSIKESFGDMEDKIKRSRWNLKKKK